VINAISIVAMFTVILLLIIAFQVEIGIVFIADKIIMNRKEIKS